MHAKFQVSSISRSEIRGAPKFQTRSRDPAPTLHGLLLHSFVRTAALYKHTKFEVSSFSHSCDMQWIHSWKKFSPTSPSLSVDGSWPPCDTMFHGPPREFTPNSVLIRSADFAAKPSWATWQTDWQTDTAHIGHNSLYLVHSMQLKKPESVPQTQMSYFSKGYCSKNDYR